METPDRGEPPPRAAAGNVLALVVPQRSRRFGGTAGAEAGPQTAPARDCTQILSATRPSPSNRKRMSNVSITPFAIYARHATEEPDPRSIKDPVQPVPSRSGARAERIGIRGGLGT